MLHRGYVRRIQDGLPVTDGTEVRVYLHETNALIQTVTTFDGEFEITFNGNPGPYYLVVEDAGETHVSSSKVVGMSGPTNVAGIPLMLHLWDDGYIPGLMGELAVTSTGVGMQVSVAAGAALVQGVLYDQASALPLTIAAADAQPRIDTVAIQVVPPYANDDTEGRALIVVKKGTPAATPTAPSLTQTATLYEMALAYVTVDPGVSSIATDKVTSGFSRADVKIDDGYLTTVMFADGAVTSAKIADGTIATADLANNAVTSAKIADGTIVAADLADGAVTSAKIADGTIATADLANGAVTTAKIATDAVDSTKILDGTIVAANLADGAVTSAKILNGTIVGADLADNSITTGKIATGAVGTTDLADDAVTAAKLAPNAITSAAILDGTIVSGDLANSAVTNAKIATDAVTGAKIADASISTAHIINGTIAEADLSAAVATKLNAHGYSHQTMAPFDFVTVSSTSVSTIKSTSLTLPAGRWALVLQYEGQVGSTTDAYGAIQLTMTGTAVGGLIASHAVYNIENRDLTTQNVSFIRINVREPAVSTSYTLTLQGRRISGANGKVYGVLNIYAIKVG